MSLSDGNGNGVGKAKAKEVLNLCLSSESPEFQAKVYEIVALSGLDPNDPMFLVLALTGQIRVFLEAAPKDLGRLLTDWQRESAKSLSELMSAISLVKDTQQEQALVIKENLSEVSQQCVSDIKEAGMATVGAIADANGETLDRVQQTEKRVENLAEKLAMIDAKFDERERRNIDSANDVVKWANSTSTRLEKVNHQVGELTTEIAEIQRNKVWLRIADCFWSVPALAAIMLISMGSTWWVASKKYNDSNSVFGREIVSWSIDRIINCQKTSNPKSVFVK